ncbi:hypothetical protein AMTR_s00078p00139590 [Amborella trichopoda]|uniref:ATPase AAA-type core domain-containing protein n=1 Tax=Amborella trichopoda TaxID=13333 RepID=W1P838_AMBTC|nr:hypothetical protein AMTR_s00078p00139590 [Amborella trichopoda]
MYVPYNSEIFMLQAVDESLKSLNLYNGGFGDKRAGNYSAGMKRRLSDASSLIGNPQVVYLDEPSTGLDPTSRNSLWSVIKSAKQDRAIILTSNIALVPFMIPYFNHIEISIDIEQSF